MIILLQVMETVPLVVQMGIARLPNVRLRHKRPLATSKGYRARNGAAHCGDFFEMLPETKLIRPY